MNKNTNKNQTASAPETRNIRGRKCHDPSAIAALASAPETRKPTWKVRQENGLELTDKMKLEAELEQARQELAGERLNAVHEMAKLIEQRDELIAAWRAFLGPIQDEIDSAVLAGRITPSIRQMQETIASMSAAIAKIEGKQLKL